MVKIALWQVAFYTIFVFSLSTYLPSLFWGAYLAAYVVLIGLWVIAISEMRRRWRSFLQSRFPKKGAR